MGKQQIIVTIGRENGSGGHYIAEKLAQRLGVRLYDQTILEGTEALSGYSKEVLARMDEKPRRALFNRKVGEHSTSLEEHAAHKTFEFIKASAKNGDSFVIVGRCADYVLRGHPGLLRIFIYADESAKIVRTMERRNLPMNKAAKYIRDTDRKRRAYHDYYCDGDWGDRSGYDLLINSTTVGLDGTVDVLEKYVSEFYESLMAEYPAKESESKPQE